MKLEIVRHDDIDGTWGSLKINGQLFCWTIERPWADNIPYVSCIPDGRYTCRRNKSSKFGETFEVVDVPGRTLIKFHWGSYVEDYQGCIGLGNDQGRMGNRRMLKNTKATFEKFMKRMEDVDEFSLKIRTV